MQKKRREPRFVKTSIPLLSVLLSGNASASWGNASASWGRDEYVWNTRNANEWEWDRSVQNSLFDDRFSCTNDVNFRFETVCIGTGLGRITSVRGRGRRPPLLTRSTRFHPSLLPPGISTKTKECFCVFRPLTFSLRLPVPRLSISVFETNLDVGTVEIDLELSSDDEVYVKTSSMTYAQVCTQFQGGDSNSEKIEEKNFEQGIG